MTNRLLPAVVAAILCLLIVWANRDSSPSTPEGPSEPSKSAETPIPSGTSGKRPASEHAPARTERPSEGTTAWGRVADDEGNPVPGAVIEVAAKSNPFDIRPQQHLSASPHRGTTQTDGSFEVSRPLAKEFFDIRASHPRFAARVVLAVTAEDLPIDITLRPGIRVTGLVVDPTGLPIPGATVRTGPSMRELENGTWIGSGGMSSRDGIVVTTSDREGRFDLAGIAGREVSLRASHPDWSPSVPINVRRSVDRVRLILSEPTAVRGRVIDEFGTPIAGAKVRQGSAHSLAAPTVTDSDGMFLLRGLNEGARSISGVAKGFPSRSVTLDPTLFAGEERNDITLQLIRGADIVGLVLDEQDRPVVGAEIIVVLPGNTLGFHASAHTDRRGRFRVEAYRVAGRPPVAGDPAPTFGLQVEHESILTHVSPDSIPLLPGDEFDVGTVRVAAAPIVSGRIINSAGAGIAGADVILHDASLRPDLPGQGDGFGLLRGPPMFERLRKTDADGRFAIPASQTGNFRITAAAGGYQRTMGETFSVEADMQLPDFELPPDVAIFGTLVDQDGDPVPGAELSASLGESRARTETGEDGTFSLGGLSPGIHYPMYLHESGWIYENETLFLEPSAEPVTIVALEPGAVEILVVDHAGNPVSNFAVTYTPNAQHQNSRPAEVLDPDGLFFRDGLPATPIGFRIESPGYATWTDFVTIEPGRVTLVEATLTPPALLRGRVLSSDGNPLEGATIQLSRGFGSGYLNLSTDIDGRFSWDELPAGDYQGSIQHSAHLPTDIEPFTARAGQTLNLPPIVMSRGSRLWGSLRLPDGTRPPWANLHIRDLLSKRGSYDPESGEYEVVGIPPGDYTLVVGFPAGGRSERWEGPVTITEGQDLRLPVQLTISEP